MSLEKRLLICVASGVVTGAVCGDMRIAYAVSVAWAIGHATGIIVENWGRK